MSRKGEKKEIQSKTSRSGTAANQGVTKQGDVNNFKSGRCTSVEATKRINASATNRVNTGD